MNVSQIGYLINRGEAGTIRHIIVVSLIDFMTFLHIVIIVVASDLLMINRPNYSKIGYFGYSSIGSSRLSSSAAIPVICSFWPVSEKCQSFLLSVP